MNVFVLSTGRSGTTAFMRASSHITNFSAGHETRVNRLGDDRFAYPQNHIEADNRLTWLLGRLDEAYGDAAFYVHLVRDRDAVAESFDRRWDYEDGIGRAYRNGVLMKSPAPPRDCLYDMIDTVNANIRHFLKEKSRAMDFRLETAAEDFPVFWRRIGAEGDLSAALAEWGASHNASAPTPPQKSAAARLRRAVGAVLNRR